MIQKFLLNTQMIWMISIKILKNTSYFAVPKNIRLNSAQYFVMKIPGKREIQQIAFIRYWLLRLYESL